MLNLFKVSISKLSGKSPPFLRLYQTSANHLNDVKSKEDVQENEVETENLIAKKAKKTLMEFFDLPENWNKSEVKSGRSWRKEELRIKSNEDLHKLWFVLYKERNMLLTMLDAANNNVENMASPERIDKVEDSMANIEAVVMERNAAYWNLEVGDSQYVSRRRVFRKDIFGQWKWIACSEHLIPYWMNNEWRKENAPGFGPDVVNFNRLMRERKQNKQSQNIFDEAFYCRQLMKRFETLDLDYLQELFPNVNVQFIKKTLNEHCLQDRVRRFNSIFYHKRPLIKE